MLLSPCASEWPRHASGCHEHAAGPGHSCSLATGVACAWGCVCPPHAEGGALTPLPPFFSHAWPTCGHERHAALMRRGAHCALLLILMPGARRWHEACRRSRAARRTLPRSAAHGSGVSARRHARRSPCDAQQRPPLSEERHGAGREWSSLHGPIACSVDTSGRRLDVARCSARPPPSARRSSHQASSTRSAWGEHCHPIACSVDTSGQRLDVARRSARLPVRAALRLVRPAVAPLSA